MRSQTDKEITYEVSLLQPCPGRATCLRCHNCQVCHHMTKCTCPHYSRGNVCKHIHAICHRNPEIVAARFPKISREERLQELHELAPLIAARQPNELQDSGGPGQSRSVAGHYPSYGWRRPERSLPSSYRSMQLTQDPTNPPATSGDNGYSEEEYIANSSTDYPTKAAAVDWQETCLIVWCNLYF